MSQNPLSDSPSWEVSSIPPLVRVSTLAVFMLIPMSQETHTSTLLWFHGLGDKAKVQPPLHPAQLIPLSQGWESTWLQLQPQIPHTKIILPSAPPRSLSMSPVATPTTAWFEILTLDPNGSEDLKGIADAFERGPDDGTCLLLAA